MAEEFDREAFYAALNATRLSRMLSWKEVASETGVAASTLSRIGQGSNPDVNGLAALLKWANLKAEMFMPSVRNDEVEPIAKISALLRADSKLSNDHAKLLEDIISATYSRLVEG